MATGSWDYSMFWNEAIDRIKQEVSPQEASMWFENLQYLDSKESEIRIAVPSSFYRDQVKQRYLSLISETLHDLSGKTFTLEFVVQPSKKNTASSKETKQQDNPSSSGKKIPAAKRGHAQLKPEYIFDNFVIGENNSFAANAAYAIGKNPGTSYNPCLIYGGVGLGKTHLLQSIGNLAYSEQQDLKIVYVTAETFTNEFTEAIREKKNLHFKNKYRSVDILLIDDIHFLQGKSGTQEELFHTFNALYDSNKQIVFTCDRPVSELKEMKDRLRNRFERGLNVDLQPPDYETRYAILKQKIGKTKVYIPDEVIELISRNITTNVRDLEAALTRLIAYSDLVNKNITLETTKQLLKDAFSSPKQVNISIEMIQRVVADYFNISLNDLRGKKRTKAIVLPRQMAMFITREMTEFSTTEVGLEFGGRDHTTVMHACQRIESRMNSDSTLEPTVQGLIRKVKEFGTKD